MDEGAFAFVTGPTARHGEADAAGGTVEEVEGVCHDVRGRK